MLLFYVVNIHKLSVNFQTNNSVDVNKLINVDINKLINVDEAVANIININCEANMFTTVVYCLITVVNIVEHKRCLQQ